ncbi:MAG TPA: mismatch-specific DNA-glycosylase [Acidimicrobiia bacterium]
MDGVTVRRFQDVGQESLPLELAELQRAMVVGARARLGVAGGWERRRLESVVVGAGFSFDRARRDGSGLSVEASRLRTLPDTVGPAMRLLLVGLNPSVYSADRGIGFARPGNRFWPAALAAGLVTRDREPFDALRTHGVGMTDLVKRATARADELAPTEYRAGAARVEALVEWLAPATVCFVGLSGYRVVADRKAAAGWQDASFGGRPVYVMPNPSGLNAHATPALLAEHLRTVQRGPG